jgi:excisionase family DNA binding protein
VRAQTPNPELECLVRLIVRDELERHRSTSSVKGTVIEGVDRGSEARNAALTTVMSDVADDASDSHSNAEVMSAEDVAAFLGVDRNTVYDYAGRGTIPCRRLGKRLLFHRPALVSWLDPSKAASTRKA